MRRAKLAFQSLMSRFTGFSTPIFGIQWNPSEPEREAVRRLINFLEDRRVLFNPYDLETESEVVHSIGAIRQELTKAIGDLPDKAAAVGHYAR